MGDALPSAVVDITHEVCPMTYVRTKLRLEGLPAGALLEVRLRGEEPLRNVPRSAQEEGHEVVGLWPLADGVFKLWLRKSPQGD
jgi:TusA-related sulfurtransferase